MGGLLWSEIEINESNNKAIVDIINNNTHKKNKKVIDLRFFAVHKRHQLSIFGGFKYLLISSGYLEKLHNTLPINYL